MNNVLNYSKRFMKRNASTILTTIGGAGVITTSVMAVKATPKAMLILEQAKEEKGEELTKLEIIKVATPIYIPTILVGASTIACIFGANVLSKRNQAALISAYALLDNSYKEYKSKIKELYGEDVDLEIRTEMAKDHYEKDDAQPEDDGKKFFYDEYSMRSYRIKPETALRAEYEINKMLNESGMAYLNDYYDLLGIPRTDYGNFVGWSSAQMYEMYWDSWIHFNHEKIELKDGSECWIINFTEPFPEFDEY